MMLAPSGIAPPFRRVGIAGAVEALVARAHEAGARGERWRCEDDALADHRVAAHELPLVLVERAGLVEDLVRDRGLADVVKLGRECRSA